MSIKKFFLIASMVILSMASVLAQAPQGFTYQAVVRDANGKLITNAPIGVRMTILQGSSTGTMAFSDEYRPQTNANGLFSIVIGDGVNSINSIDWAQGPYFLKSEVDPNGGNNYTINTVQQLLSVPYALHAQTAGNVSGGINYDSLTNKPTNISYFTNDAGYLTSYTESQALYNVLSLGNAANSQIKNLTNPTDSMDAVNLRTVVGLLNSMTHYYDSIINNLNKAIDSLRQNIDTTSSGGFSNAQFSVSATQKVYFSPGNLQWSAKNGDSTATTHAVAGGGTAAGTWRFAPNQWDTIGANNKNISSTYSGWIDLFGWGTSGYNNKYPYMTSTTTSDYGNGNNNISGTNYDWGVYNAIYNPKTQTTDAPGTWRTLTKDEWVYLMNTRSTSSGVRYAKANVMGTNGVIIVPDNWSTSVYTLNSTNTTSANYTTNIINSNDWVKMENAGCVFLPAAGSRNGTSVDNVGSIGYYWSGTYYYSDNAFSLYFYSSNLDPSSYYYRYFGLSVRLVRSAQ
ncbi:MAG: hypothetical protein J5606_09225 [Bacteroidales bacterium]|nr:hypothetical protein [Bacteroidales bacterium]